MWDLSSKAHYKIGLKPQIVPINIGFGKPSYETPLCRGQLKQMKIELRQMETEQKIDNQAPILLQLL